LKKLQYISFAVFFTVLTVGVSIGRHYASGELYSIALYGDADSCCEIPSDCCDDKTDVIQFTANYLFSISTNPDHSEVTIDLFADYTFNVSPHIENVDEIVRVFYSLDLHSPRETSTYLSQIQTYLL
jgi:hypothetical protein